MVNYHLLKGSVVLNYDGQTFTLAESDKRFDAVVAAIKAGKLDDIPKIVDVRAKLQAVGMDLKDGVVMYKDEAMPTQLYNRLEEFHEANLPMDRLLRFWDNLKLNPSFNSRKMLFDFLEHHGHPLTEDGCFIAYRGVNSEFKDSYSGKFDNSPGSVCKMDRSEVDDNPNNTCSHGLHVASHSYADGFGSKLVEVKVNPRDVVAVPRDYDGKKMRVCEFKVIRECDGIKEAPIYEEETKYLVREKGFFKLTWNEVFAVSFLDAADQYQAILDSRRKNGFDGELIVRKGNSYETFNYESADKIA